MASISKNPRGGAGLLFLAGFGLEVVVALVALRTVLADFTAEALGGRKEEGQAAAISDVLAPPPQESAAAQPPAEPGTIAALQVDIATAIPAAAVICAGLAEDADRGATMTMKVAVAADGTVERAEAAGVSGPFAACIEAEAYQWQLTAPGRPTEIVNSLRLD